MRQLWLPAAATSARAAHCRLLRAASATAMASRARQVRGAVCCLPACRAALLPVRTAGWLEEQCMPVPSISWPMFLPLMCNQPAAAVGCLLSLLRAVAIDTASSSSLVGTHFAATAILTGGSTRGISAGVNLPMNWETTAMFAAAGVCCPPFTDCAHHPGCACPPARPPARPHAEFRCIHVTLLLLPLQA